MEQRRLVEVAQVHHVVGCGCSARVSQVFFTPQRRLQRLQRPWNDAGLGAPDCKLDSSMDMKLPLAASSWICSPSSIRTVIWVANGSTRVSISLAALALRITGTAGAAPVVRRLVLPGKQVKQGKTWRTFPLPPVLTFAGDHVSTSWLYHTHAPTSNAAMLSCSGGAAGFGRQRAL